MTPDTAHALLTENFAPWVVDLALEVTEITQAQTVTRMALTDRLVRVGGIVCGQALTAQADTTIILALAGHRGAFVPAGTVTLDTQFLRPASGSEVLCTARIVRAGRSLAFASAALTCADTGADVAMTTATLALPDAPRKG